MSQYEGHERPGDTVPHQDDVEDLVDVQLEAVRAGKGNGIAGSHRAANRLDRRLIVVAGSFMGVHGDAAQQVDDPHHPHARRLLASRIAVSAVAQPLRVIKVCATRLPRRRFPRNTAVELRGTQAAHGRNQEERVT